ncbi:MAG: STAS domain-containing protein [Acidimicrobiales bacterium]
MHAHGSKFSLVFGRALGQVIVSIHGHVDADTSVELRHRLVDLIDGQGNRHVVLDLSRMTCIDSTGLAVFVDAHKRMQKRAGTLVFSGPQPAVAAAFGSTGLDKVFTVTPIWSHPANGYGPTTLGTRARWGRSG